MTTQEFDPPYLFTARRSTGFVDVPESGCTTKEEWDGRKSLVMSSASGVDTPALPQQSMAGPPFLKRTQTMAGNIVVFEQDDKPPQAYWLQRKIGKSSDGVMRLGYKLRPNTKPEFKTSTEAWEVALDESGGAPIVRVHLMHSSVLDMKSDDKAIHNPLDEMSALQMIAKHNSGEGHVVGTKLVATCSSHVYTILPYHPDGTLLQYCLDQGSLEEPVARFFFRQILKGLKTLQATGICHRNLSLDAIEMNGDHVYISGLGWSMLYDANAPVNEERPLPAPGGNNPQYIAPEYFGNLNGVWNGFAADLWACGLMLYSMVVSSEALFVAPIPEDKIFVELCVKGNVGPEANKTMKSKEVDAVLSDDLVDLLRNMMKSDPKERLSLEQVTEHPWVKNGEAVAPEISATSL